MTGVFHALLFIICIPFILLTYPIYILVIWIKMGCTLKGMLKYYYQLKGVKK